MITYKLSGLPEALVGASCVNAKDYADLFERYPVLKSVKSKLKKTRNKIVGFDACDG